MILIQKILLGFIGFAGGITVAGGIFSLITMLGIVNRLAARFRNAKHLYCFETCIFLGGTIGSLLTVFYIPIELGYVILVLFGLFAGVFVGSLAMALTETIKVIPILMHRVQLKKGMTALIVMLALGKGIGSLIQWLL